MVLCRRATVDLHPSSPDLHPLMESQERTGSSPGFWQGWQSSFSLGGVRDMVVAGRALLFPPSPPGEEGNLQGEQIFPQWADRGLP